MDLVLEGLSRTLKWTLNPILNLGNMASQELLGPKTLFRTLKDPKRDIEDLKKRSKRGQK